MSLCLWVHSILGKVKLSFNEIRFISFVALLLVALIRNVIFILTNKYIQIISDTDDAFFNRDWAGACRGR